MRRTREKALETRNQILDAAEAAFFEYGFARTSLADIAGMAGLTRCTIHGHFRNKGEVFTAMVGRVKLPMEMLVMATFDESETDPLGRMRDLFMFCLGNAATELHSRRVFEVLLTRCEYAGSRRLAGVVHHIRASSSTFRLRSRMRTEAGLCPEREHLCATRPERHGCRMTYSLRVRRHCRQYDLPFLFIPRRMRRWQNATDGIPVSFAKSAHGRRHAVRDPHCSRDQA